MNISLLFRPFASEVLGLIKCNQYIPKQNLRPWSAIGIGQGVADFPEANADIEVLEIPVEGKNYQLRSKYTKKMPK